MSDDNLSAPLIRELQGFIQEALNAVTSPLANFALLDFPQFANVGDSAIWLGALRYFCQVHSREPTYVCSQDSIDYGALERAVPEGALFIQGGGNFGDLYPRHQDFRESIVQRFPNHTIVQLPQSIHFESSRNLDRARRIINGHHYFHLFVRDRKSYEIATNSFTCPVHLCPDLAFFLGPLRRPWRPAHNRVFLLRRDKEMASSVSPYRALPGNFVMFDWIKEPLFTCRRIKLKVALNSLRFRDAGQFSTAALRPIYYRQLAEERLLRGLKLLASGKIVVTDRLHGHILCLLLGIPHFALDNSYGKISGFIDTWTAKCDLVRLPSSLREAAINEINPMMFAGTGKAIEHE
jgi:exopolysaccharide biosynthesis predicted pyruvyltransferase EpsI